jgi:hypothetical protein
MRAYYYYAPTIIIIFCRGLTLLNPIYIVVTDYFQGGINDLIFQSSLLVFILFDQNVDKNLIVLHKNLT